jgi:hypothetical protein
VLPGIAPLPDGPGSPEDLVAGVLGGVDLFDCVVPTRHGRHGSVFTQRGGSTCATRGTATTASRSTPTALPDLPPLLRALPAPPGDLRRRARRAAAVAAQHRPYMKLVRDMREAIASGRLHAGPSVARAYFAEPAEELERLEQRRTQPGVGGQARPARRPRSRVSRRCGQTRSATRRAADPRNRSGFARRSCRARCGRRRARAPDRERLRQTIEPLLAQALGVRRRRAGLDPGARADRPGRRARAPGSPTSRPPRGPRESAPPAPLHRCRPRGSRGDRTRRHVRRGPRGCDRPRPRRSVRHGTDVGPARIRRRRRCSW